MCTCLSPFAPMIARDTVMWRILLTNTWDCPEHSQTGPNTCYGASTFPMHAKMVLHMRMCIVLHSLSCAPKQLASGAQCAAVSPTPRWHVLCASAHTTHATHTGPWHNSALIPVPQFPTAPSLLTKPPPSTQPCHPSSPGNPNAYPHASPLHCTST